MATTPWRHPGGEECSNFRDAIESVEAGDEGVSVDPKNAKIPKGFSLLVTWMACFTRAKNLVESWRRAIYLLT